MGEQGNRSRRNPDRQMEAKCHIAVESGLELEATSDSQFKAPIRVLYLGRQQKQKAQITLSCPFRPTWDLKTTSSNSGCLADSIRKLLIVNIIIAF